MKYPDKVKFWVVVNVSGGFNSLRSHYSHDRALAEAENEARAEPGHVFAVLECIEVVFFAPPVVEPSLHIWRLPGA